MEQAGMGADKRAKRFVGFSSCFFAPLSLPPSLAQEQAGGQTGKGAEEVIAKGSVNVLGKEFADLPTCFGGTETFLRPSASG
jgi:hypothetical protein